MRKNTTVMWRIVCFWLSAKYQVPIESAVKKKKKEGIFHFLLLNTDEQKKGGTTHLGKHVSGMNCHFKYLLL